MVQYQLKLRLNKSQEFILNEWLWNLTGVYNWALRKIELNARDNIYFSKLKFNNLLANHSLKLKVPSHTIQAISMRAYNSWDRCFRKISGKPRLKGNRNKLNSIPFPDVIKRPDDNRIKLRILGSLKFHKQFIPEGKIKNGRIIKKASGWYLGIVIDVDPNKIIPKNNDIIGIDPGFKSLLTLSNGIKIPNPREFNKNSKRLGQVQRGKNKKLTARIQEHIKNQKKDRNHKLSRNLVEDYKEIYFSRDNIKGISKKFGRSVSNVNHRQLRQMLSYKSSACGRTFIEVDNKNSTRTCSTCGSITGPSGISGLKVRQWECDVCGSFHDRDINSAINTLIAGSGSDHEKHSNMQSETILSLEN